MPDHVRFIEVHKGKTVYALQHIRSLEQAAAPGVRQIDLRNVTRDHRFRIKSQPRDKHLHLFRSCILRFIQDHERIIQRAPAHEGDRRDLDHIFLQIAINFLRLQHVIERVVKRP